MPSCVQCHAVNRRTNLHTNYRLRNEIRQQIISDFGHTWSVYNTCIFVSFLTTNPQLLRMRTVAITVLFGQMAIHRFIRLCPRRTCEQELVSLSDAILHNSAARAKHTRTHDGVYSIRLLIVQWVVIGQYAMGQSLMDRSINGCK